MDLTQLVQSGTVKTETIQSRSNRPGTLQFWSDQYILPDKSDTCDVSLQEHTQSLLQNIQSLHQEKLFSDLQIFCDDGVVESYR